MAEPALCAYGTRCAYSPSGMASLRRSLRFALTAMLQRSCPKGNRAERSALTGNRTFIDFLNNTRCNRAFVTVAQSVCCRVPQEFFAQSIWSAYPTLPYSVRSPSPVPDAAPTTGISSKERGVPARVSSSHTQIRQLPGSGNRSAERSWRSPPGALPCGGQTLRCSR